MNWRLLKAAVKNRNFANNLVLDVYSYVPQNANSGLKHPQIAMMGGVLGSLSKEMPHWQIKHVDTDKPLELTMLHASYEGSHQTLNYRHGHYLTKSLTRSSCIEDEDFLQTKGVYLVLGGMGGIGQRLTDYLIDHYQAKVILVGRRALDEAGSAFINAHAGHVEFIQTDVTHATECALLLKYLQLKYPTIDAVFDLVMKLQDKTVDSMSWEAFNEVIKVKLLSGYFIKQLHQQVKINAAVIFSSMQSYTCFAGQANYAAASCSLDAYCKQLDKLAGLNIKIINWSIWEEIGAVADTFYLNKSRELGFIPLTTQQAWEAMELGLNSQYKQFAVQNKTVAETTKPLVYSEMMDDFFDVVAL